MYRKQQTNIIWKIKPFIYTVSISFTFADNGVHMNATQIMP